MTSKSKIKVIYTLNLSTACSANSTSIFEWREFAKYLLMVRRKVSDRHYDIGVKCQARAHKIKTFLAAQIGISVVYTHMR